MKIVAIVIVVITSLWQSANGSEPAQDTFYQMPAGQAIEAELKARGFTDFTQHSSIVTTLANTTVGSLELESIIEKCKEEYSQKNPRAADLIRASVKTHLKNNLLKICQKASPPIIK